MLTGQGRLLKILFVIISVKLFIVVLLFGYDSSNEVVRAERYVFIDELLVDKSDGRSQWHHITIVVN